MDRRLLLAILLTTIVVLVVPRLFPTPPPKRPLARGSGGGGRASSAANTSAPLAVQPPVTGASPGVEPGAAGAGREGEPSTAAPAGGSVARSTTAAADTVTVTTALGVYRFSTVGAEPVQVRLQNFMSLHSAGEHVRLARDGEPVLRYRLVTGQDTIPLDQMPFAVDTPSRRAASTSIAFRAAIGPASEADIRYAIAPDSYRVHVSGEIRGLSAAGAQLLITLPSGLRSEETDTLDDVRHLAYVIKPVRDDPRSIPFAKTDTARAQTETDGPYTWLASRNKYFLVALLAPDSQQTFTGIRIIPRARAKDALARDVAATVSRPLGTDGRFAFDLYAGPQEWRQLRAVGRDLEHVNPYGGLLRGIVEPFATAVMRLLLWMHDNLKLGYGWVLVIFGVLVRLVLWPLNQTAMRSQLRLQVIQPELQAIQKKYANDRSQEGLQRQQQEMMKLYQKHGMSPFSPMMGCLPMLIPWPFLLALFFVFQNTIEFRGVSFLWLPDISQHDPYFILPLLMAVSMYFLSWIGMRNAPPNPQAKMLGYMMPVMMTVFFFKLAAGLNLYYAVQNIAALPQQWMIARQRAKSGSVTGSPAPART